MAVLVVAAQSARLLAEAAARDGHEVIALDAYGDADTRRAATRWLPIGAAGTAGFDAGRVLDALQEASVRHGAALLGWIAGGGFEGRPDLLHAGAMRLPLIGTAAADVRRVRDPRQFFAALAARGIAHPPTRHQAPSDPAGWLVKDANGCGGWHIRPAREAEAMSASEYFQKAMPGRPMSATFIANGRDARLLGFNDLVLRPFGLRPCVYSGCVGPVPVDATVARLVGDAIDTLVPAFALRGWCSLDFLCDGDAIAVLEVNPRPPASMALYGPHGQIDAQLRACLYAELPRQGAFAPPAVRGSRIVYARRAFGLDEAAADTLARWPNAHDLPAAGTRFVRGDPVCSLGAEADGADAVSALLSAGHDALLDLLET